MAERNHTTSVYMDATTEYKHKYIAEYNGRSQSGQAFFLIKKAIAEFERENGPIELPPEIRARM